MSELSNAVAIFGRPYALTKSRLGAITKIFEDRYVCDPDALKELFDAIIEKIKLLDPENSGFSFLISFSDKTHHDGVSSDLNDLKRMATGKTTERIVLKWIAKTRIDEQVNEISIIVRVTNPINPLLFFQAALSKSPNDIDNLEFELGSTCVTVDGTGQMFADECFLIIQKWIEGRNKPYAFIALEKIYNKIKWIIDFLIKIIFPLLVALGIAIVTYKTHDNSLKMTLIPATVVMFQIFSRFGLWLSGKINEWASRSSVFAMFQLTNGDYDNLTKRHAKATNSIIKFVASCFFSIILNIVAGYICFRLFYTN